VGIAQEVEVMQMPTQLGSAFVISATAMEGVTVAALESSLRTELRRLLNEPPSAAELARVKAQHELGFLQEMESLLDRATRLNQYWAYTDTPTYLAKDLERYRNATSESLMRVARTYLSMDNAARVVVLPEEKK